MLLIDLAIFFLSFLLVLIIFAVISLLYIVQKGISEYIDKVESIQNKIKRGVLWVVQQ